MSVRLARRLLYTVLALVLVSIVLLAGIIAAEVAFGRQAKNFATVSFPSADGVTLVGYLQQPSGLGPFPAIIMVHEWWGLTEDLIEKANQMAAQGYVVLAPDTYRGQATRLIPRAFWLRRNAPTDRALQDLQAAYAYLLTQPQVDRRRVAILGYCYGGGLALQYSTRNPDLAATVVYYGDLITNPGDFGALAQTKGPLLGVFGANDGQVPVREVEDFKAALSTAGIRHQITVYPGVGHAFVTAKAMALPGPAQDAWREGLLFLETHLKGR